MAFKPFDFFRKRSKVLMAILVFVAMFSFILMDALGSQQGVGAAWAARIKGWFGVVDNAVAVVDGQGLDFKRVYEIHSQRVAAIDFIEFVQREGSNRAHRDAGFTSEDFRDEKRYQKKAEEVRKNNPETMRAIESPPITLSLQAAEPVIRFNQIAQMYARAGIDLAQLGRQHPLYAVDEQVEFVHWLHKADELGIVISPERLKADILRTGHSRLREEDLPGVVADMIKQRHRSYDTDSLIKWVGNEIRVMMAKAVVHNPASRSLLAAGITPLDLWEAYVKVKTQLVVGVLPLKVTDKQFADQVAMPTKGSAGWQEFVDTKLKPFFEQYKDKEPDPARDTPGFKVPRKYQVEFIYGSLKFEATGKTDALKHYEQVALTEDAMGAVGQALGTLGLPQATLEIRRAYELYDLNKIRGRYRLPEDPLSLLIGGVPLADGSKYQMPLPPGPGPFNSGPGVERQTAAQHVLDVAAALSHNPATPFAIGAVLRPTPRKVVRGIPQAQSLEVAAAVASAGQNIGSGLFQPALLGFYARVDYTQEHQKFAEVAAGVYDEMLEDQRRYAVERDLRALEKDLADYGKLYRAELEKWKRSKASLEARGQKVQPFAPPLFSRKEEPKKEPGKKDDAKKDVPKESKEPKEPIKDYLTRWAKSRGFLYEGMKEPRGYHELLDETGATPLTSILRPLYAKAASMFAAKPDDDMKNALIGKERTGGSGETTKPLYEATDISAPNPRTNPGAKPTEFALHWKIAETEPRTPTFAEMEDKVVEAWKTKEARALIEQYAEKLAPQVKSDDGYRILLDKEGYQPEKILGRYESTGPFNYRKMNVTYMDHPPEDVIEQALASLKNKYDTLLVANKPKTICYFLVLKERKEPSATDALAVGLFDSEVIIPESTRQLKVDNQPLTQWVVSERSREFLAEWEKYFHDRTKYNAELAKQTQEEMSRWRN